MPLVVENPVLIDRSNSGSSSTTNGQVITIHAQQIVGLVPMYPCDSIECRSWHPDCCFSIPVFAEQTVTDPVRNDYNSFILQAAGYTSPTGNTQVTFTLQQWQAGAWVHKTNLTNSNFGTFNNFGTLANSEYIQFIINWRLVLLTYGTGCFRIKANTLIHGLSNCTASEAFNLKEWNCYAAHGTVRFESFMFNGEVGDIDRDGWMQDLCGVKVEDMIRLPGFFGYETSDAEDRQIELTDGKIVPARSELVQAFELRTGAWPKWAHDRLKAYGTMADELRVTDFNWNNSDYLIRRKLVKRDGNWSPKYSIGTRLCKETTVKFKEGYQKVIRTLCCGEG